MRITGGKKGGIRLSAFPEKLIRPTRDMVREAVFNSLGDKIKGASFLDIFSGTGSVGIEALSRGAGKAVFIEKERKAVAVIKKNLQIADFKEDARLICDDFEKALKRLEKENKSFDIIYCDPPYASDYYSKCLGEIGAGKIFCAEGTLILEAFKKKKLPEKKGKLELTREKLYGDTRILYYRRING